MSPEERIVELGLILPPVPPSSGAYVPAKTVGALVYLSGAVGQDAAGEDITGKAGVDRSVEEGYASARSCALIHLAQLRQHLGSLDRVHEVVSLTGFVNTSDDFAQTPAIMDGASHLLIEVFGSAGRHVRTSVGGASLPGNGLVETQLIVAIA